MLAGFIAVLFGYAIGRRTSHRLRKGDDPFKAGYAAGYLQGERIGYEQGADHGYAQGIIDKP